MIASHFRALWNSPTVNTWAAFASRTLNVVLVLPLVLRHLTDAEIALWSVFSALMVFHAMADFGFQATFTRLMAYAYAGAGDVKWPEREVVAREPRDPNWPLIRRVLGTTRWLYRALGWLLLALLLVPGSAFLWRRVGELPTAVQGLNSRAAEAAAAGDLAGAASFASKALAVTSPGQAWIAWILIIVTSVISFRASGSANYLSATGHLALVRRWEAVFGLGILVTTPLVLWLSGNLLAFVATNQGWILLTAWRNHWLARSLNDGRLRDFPPAALDRELLDIVWPHAWRAGLGSWASIGTVQLGGLIYAQQRDSLAVASYLIALRLAQTIGVAAGAPVFSRVPRLARLWATADQPAFRREARRGISVALWSAAIPLAVLGWAGPWFLQSVLHSAIAFPTDRTWSLLAFAVFWDRYGAAHLTFETAANRVRSHISASVSGAIFVVIAFALYPVIGVDALPLGMLAASGGFLAWFARRLSGRGLGLPWPAFDLRTTAGPAVFLLGTFLLRWLIR